MIPVLVDRLPQLLDEVHRLLSEEWPDYAQFLAEEHDEVATAAESFMRWLVHIAGHGLSHLPQDSIPEFDAQTELFEEIGRVQWREGRDVSALLAAYQVGARAAWHYVSSTALAAGMAPEVLAALAEAVFIFIDQLSSASAHGFVLEQSEAGATRERLRDELVELLLSDRSDMVGVRAAAVRVGWRLPREAAVLLVDPANPVGQAMLARLDSSCLLIRRRGALLGAIVPDPIRPGRRQRLVSTLRGASAVIGHPVPLEQLPFSVQIAEMAAQLKGAGVLDDDPVFAEEHLDAIIVHRDARLLDALRKQTLAPLAGLAPTVRQRLSETLASWLRHMGDRQAVAADLHIHPQTVRYRMTQLHDIFGPALDDPVARARMTLALAWTRKPARQSAGRPAGRPVDRPVDRPADHRGDHPADHPVKRSVDGPPTGLPAVPDGRPGSRPTAD
jgi:PucR C-terminal helix-turn-helix domain